MKPKNKKRK